MPPEPLALLLLRASRWFDRQLLDRLEASGWPRLTPAQSLVFAHLLPNGVPPATLARRLGTSRQATQDLVAGLVRHDLLELVPDPTRRGGRLVTLTTTGRALAREARAVLDELEDALGVERSQALRTLLADLSDDPSVCTRRGETAVAAVRNGPLKSAGDRAAADRHRLPAAPESSFARNAGSPGRARLPSAPDPVGGEVPSA